MKLVDRRRRLRKLNTKKRIGDMYLPKEQFITVDLVVRRILKQVVKQSIPASLFQLVYRVKVFAVKLRCVASQISLRE
jgi:deoxyhypusine synthase